jgi:hypothetical protein
MLPIDLKRGVPWTCLALAVFACLASAAIAAAQEVGVQEADAQHEVGVQEADAQHEVGAEEQAPSSPASPRPFRVLAGHKGGVNAVAFGPEGPVLATGGSDRTVRLWNGETGECEHVLSGHAHPITSVAFSRDAKSVAAGAKNRVILWDVASGEHMRTLETGQRVRSIGFSADGGLLCSVSEYRVRAHETETWESTGGFLSEGSLCINRGRTKEEHQAGAAATGLTRALMGEIWHFQSLCFSPQEPVLAVGTTRNKTILMRMPAWSWTGWPVLEAPEERRANVISSVAFSPNGTTLATGGSDSVVRLWQLATDDDGRLDLQEGQTQEQQQALTGHRGPVSSVCFSPSGSLLASASEDGTVRLWEADSGELLQVLTEHTGPVTSLSFSRHGVALASASADGTVRLWRMRTADTGSE